MASPPTGRFLSTIENEQRRSVKHAATVCAACRAQSHFLAVLCVHYSLTECLSVPYTHGSVRDCGGERKVSVNRCGNGEGASCGGSSWGTPRPKGRKDWFG